VAPHNHNRSPGKARPTNDVARANQTIF